MNYFAIAIFSFIAAFSLGAQTSGLPVIVEVLSSSDGDRSISEVNIIPNWTGAFSSGLKFTYVADTSMGPAIESDPATLLASQFDRWEANLTAFDTRTTIFKNRLSVGLSLGASWWNERELEKGYFAFGGDAQIMANSTNIQYILPVLGASLSADIGPVLLKNSIYYSPAFFYRLDQTTAIQPLVDGEYSQSVSGWGKTLLSNELEIRLFRIFQLSWEYDFAFLEFPFLKLGVKDGSATFYPASSAASAISNRVMGGLSLPINSQIRIYVLAGKSFAVSNDLESDVSVSDESFIWEASLTMR